MSRISDNLPMNAIQPMPSAPHTRPLCITLNISHLIPILPALLLGFITIKSAPILSFIFLLIGFTLLIILGFRHLTYHLEFANGMLTWKNKLLEPQQKIPIETITHVQEIYGPAYIRTFTGSILISAEGKQIRFGPVAGPKETANEIKKYLEKSSIEKIKISTDQNSEKYEK